MNFKRFLAGTAAVFALMLPSSLAAPGSDSLPQRDELPLTSKINDLKLEPLSHVEKKVVQVAVSQPKTAVTGSKEVWLKASGIPESQWWAVDYVISHESSWQPNTVNSIGCIGLGQNCPSRGVYWLKQVCSNWQNDPVCQLKRFDVYATERYGGWAQAYSFWVQNRWW